MHQCHRNVEANRAWRRVLAHDLPPGRQPEAEWVIDDLAGAQGKYASQPLIALEARLATVDKPELAFIKRQHRDVGSGAGAEGAQLRVTDFPRRSDGRARDD